MGWLDAKTRKSGWLVVGLDPTGGRFVHARAKNGGKPKITLYGERALPGAESAERLAKEFAFSRYQCSTLLQPGQYQLLQVEAPNVPAAERKAALRWKLKDMVDFPVEQAALDVVDVPQDAGPAGRAKTVYAVIAQSKVIRECVEPFQNARIPLSVIDIPEMAQRNIGALYEESGRALAALHAMESSSLLTVNYRTELLLARRIDFGTRHLFGAPGERNEAFERISLEVQRTFDLMDRQYPQLAISKLVVSPLPQDSGFLPYMTQNLGIAVQAIDLGEVLAFEGAAPDSALQWRLFHAFGAALRH
jgi:MSHA biogenesis protein MshI